jgi:hypothetical protein|tara:strand:- start:40 stop:633 length:594 start_codon:yes stop_codon:yes gene_type:complete
MIGVIEHSERHKKTYKGILSECAIREKAKKDIVGAHYEKFRESFIKELGFKIGKKEDISDIADGSYDPDQIILSPAGNVVAIEEDKGHYVDKCFLARAIINSGRITQNCIDRSLPVPYFILSCPTSYSKHEFEFGEALRMFRPDIKEELEKKFRYFPMCSHGRVGRKKYLKEGVFPFEHNFDFIKKEINFWKALKEA